jgi:hypothetical protein
MAVRQVAMVALLCVGVVLPVLWSTGMDLVPDALQATGTISAVALGISAVLYYGLVPVRVELGSHAVTVYRRLWRPRTLAYPEIRRVTYDGTQDAIRLFASERGRWVADLTIRTGCFSAADTEAMLTRLRLAPEEAG